jgi:alcohol dehydrogenase (cytochrome c)
MKIASCAFGLAMLFAPIAMAQTNDELVNGATGTSNVINYGMGYNLQRFSSLTQINKDSIKHLVPTWNYSFDDNRAEESQPLVYRGVIYVTTGSATMAIDAKTGKQTGRASSKSHLRRCAAHDAGLSTAAPRSTTARYSAARSMLT